DIDLLYLGDQKLQSVALTLPHPEMLNRAFVIIPLAEIDGDRTFEAQSVSEAAQAFEEIANDVDVLATP
ncbi:MAG: 2-amino-4-hydroxy-6-hydroxymethyldihydropteridine diphosphokinase, partial [Pseudomonadota bacterium]